MSKKDLPASLSPEELDSRLLSLIGQGISTFSEIHRLMNRDEGVVISYRFVDRRLAEMVKAGTLTIDPITRRYSIPQRR